MARPIKTIQPGTRFGRLKFIEDRGKESERRIALYKCDCGELIVLDVNFVSGGVVKSCGHLGSGNFRPVPDEEKERIKELYRLKLSPRKIGLMLKRDTKTVNLILGIEKEIAPKKEGFFDYDSFLKSDFIFQG